MTVDLKNFWADSSAWLERSTDKLIQISKGRGFESHSAHFLIEKTYLIQNLGRTVADEREIRSSRCQ